MTLSVADVIAHAATLNKSVSVKDAQAHLDGVDQQAILDHHKARYEVKVWDRQEAVNGIEPQVWLDSTPDPSHDGEIYFLLCDGNVLMYQPFVHDNAGWVRHTPEDVHEHAGRHVEGLATNHADNEVRQLLITKL